jgi:hypothetical protein
LSAADDNSVAVVFDFVDPIGAGRRLCSFNRLSGDHEPGRERIDFHCPEKIGWRGAGNNELCVALSAGLRLLPAKYPNTRSTFDAERLAMAVALRTWAFTPIRKRGFATVDFPAVRCRMLVLRCITHKPTELT